MAWGHPPPRLWSNECQRSFHVKSRAGLFSHACLVLALSLFLFSCGTLPKRPVDTTIEPHYVETPLTDSWDFYGSTIRYHRSGDGDPMIFLHNGGTDHRIWDYQVEVYSKTHTVFALDLPGFGESDAPEEAYTLDLYTDMLALFIEEHELRDITLVGNCMGSAMALNYTLEHPAKVKRMILFNILSEKTLQEGSYGFWQTFSRFPGGKGCFSFCAPFIWMPNVYIKGQLKKLYGDKGLDGEPDPEFLVHLRTLFKKPEQLPSLTNILVHIDRFGILDHPREIPALPPTCVFWGEKNKVLPVRAGADLCNNYNFTRIIVVPGTGHLLMREDYANINGLIDTFMTQTATMTGKN